MLTFCMLHCFNPKAETKQPVVISYCVEISSDLLWQLFVHGHKVDISTCTPLREFDGAVITVEKLNELVGKIFSMNVCAGHPEEQFVDICKCRKDQIKSHSGDVVAYRDDYYPVSLHCEMYSSTVSSTKCVNNVKCGTCKRYKSVLGVYLCFFD